MPERIKGGSVALDGIIGTLATDIGYFFVAPLNFLSFGILLRFKIIHEYLFICYGISRAKVVIVVTKRIK